MASTSTLPKRVRFKNEEDRCEPDEYRYPIMYQTSKSFMSLQLISACAVTVLFAITGAAFMAWVITMTCIWFANSTAAFVAGWVNSEDSYQGTTDYSLAYDRRYKIPVMLYSWHAFVIRLALSPGRITELSFKSNELAPKNPLYDELRAAKAKLAELEAMPADLLEVKTAKAQARITIQDLEDVEAQIIDDEARIVAGRIFTELQEYQMSAATASQTQRSLMDGYHNPMLALQADNSKVMNQEELLASLMPEVCKPEVM